MKSIFLFILTILSCVVASAQHKHFEINWLNKKNIAVQANQTFYVPGFDAEHFSYTNGTILYSTQWKSSGHAQSAQLTEVNYQPLSTALLKNINLKAIPKRPKLTIISTKGRNTTYTVLTLTPIINDHGSYKKITSFSINYQNSRQRRFATANNAPAISNSIFTTGDFYKIQIDKTGVFKLSKSFLHNLGIPTENINPRNIKIYGHGGQMLPMVNENTLYYDPPQIPIQVIGGADGSFDQDDYILFYGIGSKGNWNEDSQTNLNLYADHAYYYLTVDGGYGKRVSTYTPPTASATTTITTFDDRAYYEVDRYNIGKVGRRWFGDRFDVQPSQTYTFNFPHLIPNSELKLEVYAASTSETNTSFSVAVNGESAGNLNFSGINDVIFARSDNLVTTIQTNSDEVNVKLTYQNNGNPASVAFLDYINIWAKRKLVAGHKQFQFTYKDAALQAGIATYHLENTANISQIWDITNPYNISKISNANRNSSINFKAVLGQKRTYLAIAPQDYYQPTIPFKPHVNNSNLKGTVFRGPQGEFQDVDYLIITTKELLNQANRLASHRATTDGLSVKVVLLEDIYKEFSSGQPDISAIRNFVKYVYDNASSPAEHVQYLCLFGDASIDYKNRLQGDQTIVPTYESLYSYSLRYSSTASDDFFGMMNAWEGSMSPNDKLDIAVGRIVANNAQQAKTLVDKIVAYDSKAAFGAWRNNIVLISDDADVYGAAGSGLQQTLDNISEDINDHKPFYNIKKIYSDAYQQEYTSGGQRYPEVNEAITQNIEVGALVVNYFGHGGENGLSSEYIVTREDIKNWRNADKLNLFVTVTCEFTRFDNPLHRSPGELILLNENGGAVAMISTIRTIPVSTGTTFNQSIVPYLFNYNDHNKSAAEAVRKAKNSISSSARRVIFYFGDPAMQLAIPAPEIQLTAINGHPVNQAQDTLKALGKVNITGQVVTPNGQVINNYNGVLTGMVFDKPIERKTLGNDGVTDGNGQLVTMDFKTLGNIIFRGKASVKNGHFELDFVVPKDIKMAVGHGRVSFYAKQNGVLRDNRGYSNQILVGDLNKNAPEDNKGPEIELYLNDESFVSGGITGDSPIILAKLNDENGINTASGIGHDLVAYIDGDKTNPYVLNDYYQTKIDSYKKGNVHYQLNDLKKGPHTLTLKAWDVYNNSSTRDIQFVVTGDQELKISHVLNYPNPFHNYTEFWFNHNRPFEPLEVQVQVFTVSGKLVWTHNEVVNTKGFLSRSISWNGRDRFGDPIGKGVYIYKLTVKSTLTNQKAEKYEKLVIL